MGILDKINEKIHLAGGHAYMFLISQLPEKDSEHHFDDKFYAALRKVEKMNDAEKVTLELSVEDAKYIGNAIQIYHDVLFDLYSKRQMEELVKRLLEESKKGKI